MAGRALKLKIWIFESETRAIDIFFEPIEERYQLSLEALLSRCGINSGLMHEDAAG